MVTRTSSHEQGMRRVASEARRERPDLRRLFVATQ
jgi:hypothetical protein